ncbi:hypothetical protein [Photobacterium leiognathi]|uniref:hypothetical protein n=1 Tax=Photobacterium leiognathi TaxID=553611 RepID=UPI002738C661|nr:hypothetical protein [Photobacterium leiognathi]
MIKMKYFFLLLVAFFITGCVSPIPLHEQAPDTSYNVTKKVLISVNDQRERVKEGKPEDFIGVAHATFGIPVDWHVSQVLATEEGDKEKTLADFLEHRILHGLQKQGWNVEAVKVTSGASDSEIMTLLADNQADKLIQLNINEWYFSINLNWVSAFNFDTDTLVKIYEVNDGQILEKQIAGRDVIEEKGDESPQNNVLRAYREQLVEIFSDPEVKSKLKD